MRSACDRLPMVTMGTYSSAPEAALASTPVASGVWRAVVTTALTANAAAERRMAPTLWGSVIWSSTQHARGRDVFERGRVQGIGLGIKPLLHGLRPHQGFDRIRPHHVELHAVRDVVLGEPPGRVLCREQAVEVALRVLQRGLDAVPAVEHHRAVAIAGRTAAPRSGARLAGKSLVAEFLAAEFLAAEPFARERLAGEGFPRIVAPERLALAVVGIAVAHDGVVSRRRRRRNGCARRRAGRLSACPFQVDTGGTLPIKPRACRSATRSFRAGAGASRGVSEWQRS